MPLVQHSSLPTFTRLRDAGHEVLSLDRATHQDIRELHIGFLNMMPDAALQATERQFIRLVGGCNRIAQFYVYPFSLDGLPRSAETLAYIEQYYSCFDELKESGLDALIITGANVATPNLEDEPFWEPLMQVVDWARGNVASTLCSCLATHAVLKRFYGIDREPLPEKRWGVFDHRIAYPGHPLLRGINTRFDVPHSRYNDISREQFEKAGLKVLVESAEGGVHMAVSPDHFRAIFFQGHPEYDINSLFKEYKREVLLYLAGERTEPPPFPLHYFPHAGQAAAARFLRRAGQALAEGQAIPGFIEEELAPLLDNTWGDTGRSIISNWLGLVYQLTNLDRTLQYMEGVDRDDPLGMKAAANPKPNRNRNQTEKP
ncbi:MAG: homoserine O-succinyltransferase [Gammaproteobacteria bacterium]|nr:homoserine O-succinyltransferase [Gammaproteobacteria bacterium]NNJ77753.1 homoserine O-succinyltransferase [Xanthomonadales bacterium]